MKNILLPLLLLSSTSLIAQEVTFEGSKALKIRQK